MTRMTTLVLLTAVSLLLNLGCSKEDKSAPLKTNSDLVVSYKSENIYPHTSAFKTATHGKIFQANAKSCQTCHGDDYRGGSSKISCNSCHQSFPHTASFKQTTEHGSKYLEDRNSCTTCHGKDLKGGSAKVACLNCHQYPHDKKWALPENHGAAFSKISSSQSEIENPLERDHSKCLKCHENKPNEPTAFKNRHPEHYVACNSCHADLPHGQNFINAEGDGSTRHFRYVKNNPEKKGSCYSCHLNPKRKVPTLDTCLSCHEKEPESSFPEIGFGKEEE